MKQCQIFILNQGKTELAAELTLHDDNTITGEARNNHPNVLTSVLEDQAIYGRGGDISERTEDPAGWFNALPYQYRGTYFWAEINPNDQHHETRVRSAGN